MDRALEEFGREFSDWDINLPQEDVAQRRRGRINHKGWAIWYMFGVDDRGEYLDYYAAHRMTNDRHVRIYADGEQENCQRSSHSADALMTQPRISALRLSSSQRTSELPHCWKPKALGWMAASQHQSRSTESFA